MHTVLHSIGIGSLAVHLVTQVPSTESGWQVPSIESGWHGRLCSTERSSRPRHSLRTFSPSLRMVTEWPAATSCRAMLMPRLAWPPPLVLTISAVWARTATAPPRACAGALATAGRGRRVPNQPPLVPMPAECRPHGAMVRADWAAGVCSHPRRRLPARWSYGQRSAGGMREWRPGKAAGAGGARRVARSARG